MHLEIFYNFCFASISSSVLVLISYQPVNQTVHLLSHYLEGRNDLLRFMQSKLAFLEGLNPGAD